MPIKAQLAIFSGKPGFLGLFGGQNDGVSVVRANGVGGGSLVYSNITIRPPDLIFDDQRWPITWTPQQRDQYYDFARHAIGYGVLSALQARAPITFHLEEPHCLQETSIPD